MCGGEGGHVEDAADGGAAAVDVTLAAELTAVVVERCDADQRRSLGIADAAQGLEAEVTRSFVRPWNTFGVRMRAKIAMCGPPRADRKSSRPPKASQSRISVRG